MGGEILYFIQLVVTGIAIGCLYALIGLGFVLIFKATEIINFAQGEIVMISAFVLWYLVTAFNFSFLLASLCTFIIATLLGLAVARLVLQPMLGKPVYAVVIVTIGLSIFLRSTTGLIFKSQNRTLTSPFSDKIINIAGITLPHIQIWIILSTAVLVIIFFILFKYSRQGLAIRGVADNQKVASLMGISVKRVFALIWGVSFATAAVSGIFLANIMVINLGLSLVAIIVFPGIIMGGMTSIPGAIIGGLIIGIIENMAGGYLERIIPGGVKDVVPFVILFLFLMIKPYGLFGKKEIERV